MSVGERGEGVVLLSSVHLVINSENCCNFPDFGSIFYLLF